MALDPEKRAALVWLDMEMTGLDPVKCVPLQVAAIVTDDDLRELEAVEVTIWQPPAALESMEPYVRKMHTHNGLIEAVRASDKSVALAELAIGGLLAKWCPYRKAVLAGNSIHQDRRFLERYFPTFHGYLHYRMVDVSSFKEMVRRWYGEDAIPTKDEGKHTALADIRASIKELAHYRTLFIER